MTPAGRMPRAAFGLAVAPLVAIGLARFAYALLLPAMRAELGWSYAEAGAVNTANAAGYLAGAVIAARVAGRLGARRVFIAGLAATALALLASAGADQLAWQMLWRALSGCAGAMAFVAGAGMAADAAALARSRGGLVIATYFGGGGAGVLVSSMILPPLLALHPAAWRLGWIAMAVAAFAALGFAQFVVPDLTDRASPTSAEAQAAPRSASLVPTYVAYLCFGAGYIGYMTFIIAQLDAAAVTPLAIASFWAVLGLASVLSSYGWGELFARLAGGTPMILVLLIEAVGAALPLVSTAPAALYGSAILFGAAVMAMPGAVTVVVKNNRPPRAWTPLLGRLTVVFGLGQCAGPLATGLLADSAAGIAIGLLASAGLLLFAAAAAACQR
jgi:predicted MFS family arabinose efflux permease